MSSMAFSLDCAKVARWSPRRGKVLSYLEAREAIAQGSRGASRDHRTLRVGRGSCLLAEVVSSPHPVSREGVRGQPHGVGSRWVAAT